MGVEDSKGEVGKKKVNLTETLMSYTVRKHEEKKNYTGNYQGNTIQSIPKARTL